MVFEPGGKFFVSFPQYSFCHKLGSELNKLRHKSVLSGLGLLVWEINCQWCGVVLKELQYCNCLRCA